MLKLVRQTAVEPDTWFVVFHPTAAAAWMNRLPIGRFKHVSAFAYVHGIKAWLICDVQLHAFRLIALRDNQDALDALATITAGCTVLHLKRKDGAKPFFRIGFWCVPALKHLLGLRSSALRPDGLYRDCLRAGAKIIHEPPVLHTAGGSEPASGNRCGEQSQGGRASTAVARR